MIKKFALFCVLPLFLAAQAMGSVVNRVPDHILRSVYANYAFPGDRHEEFVGDYVVVLNDGSEWKIHPEDSDVFRQWEMNDIVHPRVRSSHYFFKREHKFELVNHTRRQTAKVMLVKYPTHPLIVMDTILEITDQFISNKKIISVYTTHIYLSDGTVWRVAGNQKHLFTNYRFVYLSVNDTADGFANFFFIVGSEREAVWIATE